MISVIIPAHNEWPQLAWTIHSIIDDMPEPYEIIVASSGTQKETKDMNKWLGEGRLTKLGLLKIIDYEEPMSPFTAGTKAIRDAPAKGDIIMWADGHIAIQHGSTTKKAELVRERGGIVHSPMVYLGDIAIPETHKLFGYKDPIKRGWTFQTKSLTDPFKVCSSAIPASMVTRKDWDEIGGVDAPFRSGVGGGETFLDMKMWMWGKPVWMHPQCLYWHDARRRGYTWTMGEFYWNQLSCHYILGGRGFMEETNKTFSYPQREKMLDEVESECQAHREFVLENAEYTLEDVLRLQPWNVE